MGKEKLDEEKERQKGKGEIVRRKKIRGKMNGERKNDGERKRKRKRFTLREGRKSEER